MTTHVDYPHFPGYLFDCPACEAQCFCTPGNSECVFEGAHNGSAAPSLDTFRDWYGNGDQGEEYAGDDMGNGACLYRLDNGELWVFQWDDAGFEDCGQVTREEWERISGSYYAEEDES